SQERPVTVGVGGPLTQDEAMPAAAVPARCERLGRVVPDVSNHPHIARRERDNITQVAARTRPPPPPGSVPAQDPSLATASPKNRRRGSATDSPNITRRRGAHASEVPMNARNRHATPTAPVPMLDQRLR